MKLLIPHTVCLTSILTLDWSLKNVFSLHQWFLSFDYFFINKSFYSSPPQYRRELSYIFCQKVKNKKSGLYTWEIFSLTQQEIVLYCFLTCFRVYTLLTIILVSILVWEVSFFCKCIRFVIPQNVLQRKQHLTWASKVEHGFCWLGTVYSKKKRLTNIFCTMITFWQVYSLQEIKLSLLFSDQWTDPWSLI